METRKLTGDDLSYWVAVAEGYPVVSHWWDKGDLPFAEDWILGGSLIEREMKERGLDIGWYENEFRAIYWDYTIEPVAGATFLEAGLRGYLVREFGEEVPPSLNKPKDKEIYYDDSLVIYP